LVPEKWPSFDVGQAFLRPIFCSTHCPRFHHKRRHRLGKKLQLLWSADTRDKRRQKALRVAHRSDADSQVSDWQNVDRSPVAGTKDKSVNSFDESQGDQMFLWNLVTLTFVRIDTFIQSQFFCSRDRVLIIICIVDMYSNDSLPLHWPTFCLLAVGKLVVDKRAQWCLN
jgi:hypothetical protein